MTLPFIDDVVCAICGNESITEGLMSTNTMGPPDLDMRPAEMHRSTMGYWVANCEKCGFCSANISDDSENAHWLIKTPEYISTLNEENYPPLANIFRCKSIINETDGDYAKSAWASLHGAWVCDDQDLPEQSYTCRINAIRLLRETENNVDVFSDEEGVTELVLIDMLRRVGKYEEANREITKCHVHIDDPSLLRILIYQAILIGNKDRSCHTIPTFDDEETS